MDWQRLLPKYDNCDSANLYTLVGDHVQWFWAEAEMQHWQEEWEIKQADFLRCIHTFSTMSNVWKALGEDNLNGKAAYTKKKLAMFKAMESEARLKLVKAGHGNLLDLLVPGNGKILADYVEEEWRKHIISELMWKVHCHTYYPSPQNVSFFPGDSVPITAQRRIVWLILISLDLLVLSLQL